MQKGPLFPMLGCLCSMPIFHLSLRPVPRLGSCPWMALSPTWKALRRRCIFMEETHIFKKIASGNSEREFCHRGDIRGECWEEMVLLFTLRPTKRGRGKCCLIPSELQLKPMTSSGTPSADSLCVEPQWSSSSSIALISLDVTFTCFLATTVSILLRRICLGPGPFMSWACMCHVILLCGGYISFRQLIKMETVELSKALCVI